PRGPVGPAGPVPFGPEQPWLSGQTYSPVPPASIVSHDGSSYVCRTAHTSTSSFTNDINNWALLAAKGDKGDKGEQGLQGRQGEQGLTGERGPTTWTVV